MSAEIAAAVDCDVKLIAGSGGVFDVERDGALLFSKHQVHRFPNEGEMALLVQS